MNFIYGNDPGMPSLGTLGTGDLVSIMDVALVNGGTTQSITGITRTGTVATATKTAHGFRDGQLVTVSGAGESGYNTTERITRIDANSFSYTVAGTPATPATGTILAKIAPCGGASVWGVEFTATNKRVYRAASGARHYLRIDDSAGTNTAIVGAYTAMTDIDTGTGAFPTTTQAGASVRWARPNPTTYSSTTASPGSTYNDSWVIVGDDKRVFIGICMGSAGNRDWMGFGEFQSYLPSDVYNSFIFGFCNTSSNDTISMSSQAPKLRASQSGQGSGSYYDPGIALARAYNQTTESFLVGLGGGFSGTSLTENSTYAIPSVGTSSPISGGIELAAVDLIENTSGSYYYRRGRMPFMQTWNPPDFESNAGTVYRNVTNFGDIVLIRGWYAYPAKGLIFPVGDWDTTIS